MDDDENGTCDDNDNQHIEVSSESESDDDRIVSCYANGSEPSGDEGCFFTNPFKSQVTSSFGSRPISLANNNLHGFNYNTYMQSNNSQRDDRLDEMVDYSQSESGSESESESDTDPETLRKGSFAQWIKKVHGNDIVIPPKPINSSGEHSKELIDVDTFEPFVRMPDSRTFPPKPSLNSVLVECLDNHCTPAFKQDIQYLYDRGPTLSSYTSKQLSMVATLFDNLILHSYIYEIPLWPMSKASLSQVEYLSRQYSIFSSNKIINGRKTIYIIIHKNTKKPSIRKKEKHIEAALTEYMNALSSSNSSNGISTSNDSLDTKSSTSTTLLSSSPRKNEKTILYNRKGKVNVTSPRKHPQSPQFYKGSPRGLKGSPHSNKGNSNTSSPSTKSPLRLHHGDVVDGNREPISDTNIGNIMLKKMGWTGGGLGSTGQGMDAPIKAVVRKDR
ncbi:hypothetical protein SAMD00019534_036190, partial [Acytostelium subglobosum LB1]|uniref:hypothetical protein n=1 Tax=Acytostelium subglobosum LB1 TaxID=1410327 RepID=UPI000644BA14